MGIATAVRSARKSVHATRTLVGALLHAGFRAVMIEGVDTVASHLDHHVQTGRSGGAARSGQGFVRNLEHHDLVRSLRRCNAAHPDDLLVPSPPADFLENALVGIDAAPRLPDLSALDEDGDATPA